MNNEQDISENKNVTNNQLLEVISKGFTAIENRFKEVEEKIATQDDLQELREKMEDQFEGVNQRIEGLGSRIDSEVTKRADTLHDLQRRTSHLEKLHDINR